MSATTTLYRKEELVSLYQQAIQNHKEALVQVLSPTSLVPFVRTGIISDEQKNEWSVARMPKEESRRLLIALVLEKSDLDCYIKFSRSLQYINAVESKRVFPFTADLLAVGLHDPIDRKGFVSLSPRGTSNHIKLVVLWIIQSDNLFQHILDVIPGWKDVNLNLKDYRCQKLERVFELYVVCRITNPLSPGRKFDELLAKFNPCPTFVVYSGDCLHVGGASLTPLQPESFVVVPAKTPSPFDLSPEALHAAEMWRLKNSSEDGVPPRPSMAVGQATRFAYEQGASVHSPDAITLHTAASKCCLPIIIVNRVVASYSASTSDSNFCDYVYNIIREMLVHM